MRKSALLLLLVTVVVGGCARTAKIVRKPPPEIKRVEKAEPAAFPEEVFPVGEKLTYRLKWSGINVGTATFQVEGVANVGKSAAYRLVARGKPSRGAGLVYKIDKTLISYFDAKRLFSLRFERERQNNEKEVYVFNQDNHSFTYARGEKNWSGSIPPRTQDMLSVVYYLRLLEHSEKRLTEVNATLKKKNYRVEFETIGREKVVVPAGTFDTLEISPRVEVLLSGDKRSSQKDVGRLRIWLSNDKKKLPVLAKSRVFLGTVTFTLINIETGN